MSNATLIRADRSLPRAFHDHPAFWKLCLLLLILVLEVLFVSFRFDSHALENRFAANVSSSATSDHREVVSYWLAWSLARSSQGIRLAIVAATITVVLSGKRVVDSLGQTAAPDFWTHIVPWLIGHVAAFLGFLSVTGKIFEGGVLETSAGTFWISAWLGLGVLLVVALAASVFRAASWRRLAPVMAQATLAGLVVGIVAVGAGQITSQFWLPLARVTLDSVHVLMCLFESNIIYEPSKFIVGTERFTVSIAPECSGYEGIGLILAFASVYLFLFRSTLRFPHALLILPIGAVAIWLANILRITALIEVGTRMSSEVARGGFHSQAGWIAFNIVGLGLAILARRTRVFQRPDLANQTAEPVISGASISGERVSPEAVYLGPLIAIVATTIVTTAFSVGGVDRLYPLRLAAVAVPLWLFRRQYLAMRWSVSWPSVAIGVGVYFLWIARSLISTAPPSEILPTAALFGAWAVPWVVMRMLGSIVTVPIAEELAFRGFLTRRLISADFSAVPAGSFAWGSFLVSSMAFGVLHHHWAEGIAAGMLYALAYYRSGSIGDAVLAHGTTNVLLSVQVVMLGDWSIIS
jgi:exosortase E/protease (VPEID-CTERM system)